MKLVKRLAEELKVTIGRGFSKRNLEQYRKFYKLYQNIAQTPSALSWPPDGSGQSTRTLLPWLLEHFTLSWSHYVTLLTVDNPDERRFYEIEAVATVLSDMDAEIAALEQRRDKTRQIKQGMMQQLLTGRVRLV